MGCRVPPPALTGMRWHGQGDAEPAPAAAPGRAACRGAACRPLKYRGRGRSQGGHPGAGMAPRAGSPGWAGRANAGSELSPRPRQRRQWCQWLPTRVAPGPEQGIAAGFILPQRGAGQALAAAVLQSLFSHHRPFLPRILNSEISVKVRARFADSLCRKHGGAGESKAFAAGRPFFGRRCSPFGDQLSFPKPRERFVSYLEPSAEIPQAQCFGGHGRSRAPDSPETSGCSGTESCWCRGWSQGSPQPGRAGCSWGHTGWGGRCQRVLAPLQPPAAGTKATLPEQEQAPLNAPLVARGRQCPWPQEPSSRQLGLAVMPRGMRAAGWHRA